MRGGTYTDRPRVSSAVAAHPITSDANTADYRILQRKLGQRYSLDDVATAWEAVHARPQAARAIDLGTGIGSVLLMVAWKLQHARIEAIEAQEVSFRLLAQNVANNGLSDRVRIHHGDLRDRLPFAEKADLVTGTPPYLPPGTATEALDGQRAHARIELRGGVEAYCVAAAACLASGGAFVICADARTPERTEAAGRAAGLHPLAKRDVIPRAGKGRCLRFTRLFARRMAQRTRPSRSSIRSMCVTPRASSPSNPTRSVRRLASGGMRAKHRNHKEKSPQELLRAFFKRSRYRLALIAINGRAAEDDRHACLRICLCSRAGIRAEDHLRRRRCVVVAPSGRRRAVLALSEGGHRAPVAGIVLDVDLVRVELLTVRRRRDRLLAGEDLAADLGEGGGELLLDLGRRGDEDRGGAGAGGHRRQIRFETVVLEGEPDDVGLRAVGRLRVREHRLHVVADGRRIGPFVALLRLPVGHQDQDRLAAVVELGLLLFRVGERLRDGCFGRRVATVGAAGGERGHERPACVRERLFRTEGAAPVAQTSSVGKTISDAKVPVEAGASKKVFIAGSACCQRVVGSAQPAL
ncbi:hypothetical protein OUZ56_032498 [Daphnia magna]|uniref:Methyltransferase small domain-containing protein n=1 Tax=Daphnia magna TaxID=35525 RepID=A0ABR0B9I0_9CRUS|nr:hypothetical protein OUZ56_032498 [Daphnia magna]